MVCLPARGRCRHTPTQFLSSEGFVFHIRLSVYELMKNKEMTDSLL